MDAAGITHGVIMGRMAQGKRRSLPNDEIADTCRRFSGRFIPFAGVDLSGEDMSAALARTAVHRRGHRQDARRECRAAAEDRPSAGRVTVNGRDIIRDFRVTRA